jgi:NAD+ synthase (glutamine-hydrolysing)
MLNFIRVAAYTPKIRVADCDYNAAQIVAAVKRADCEDVRLLCMPELCVTGSTCGELFFRRDLIESAAKALAVIVRECAEYRVLAVVGLPIELNGKIFNVAAVFCCGRILGFVPKDNISGGNIFFQGEEIPFGKNLIFGNNTCPEFKLAIGDNSHATVVAYMDATEEIVGAAAARRAFAASESARLACAYIYANAGCGESTTDAVFSARNLICENGELLAEALPFGDGWAMTEIDIDAIAHERRRRNILSGASIGFSLTMTRNPSARKISPTPFIVDDDVISIQAHALAKRLEHTKTHAVLGISGGLDSTLALLATVRAYQLLSRENGEIIAVTMPCFGTTERTKSNAHKLCDALGVPCREIDITKTVQSHLRDISHDEASRDITYENAQARVRTLTLMDLANKHGGIVIGSGNLSELALGWTTFGGDHLSMYGVNAGVPKTLVRHVVSDCCEKSEPALKAVLQDILATPVSPELLPPANGEITQHTESIVGSYELIDFFIYHFMRHGRSAPQILELAAIAFENKFPYAEIKSRLQQFFTRFFAQQFKRNCLPDSPKICCVSLSPRGGWNMPSDIADVLGDFAP